jgi:hypothetical protein
MDGIFGMQKRNFEAACFRIASQLLRGSSVSEDVADNCGNGFAGELTRDDGRDRSVLMSVPRAKTA